MNPNEMADAIMEILGFDTTDPRIVEVEAGNQLNSIQVEDSEGRRFEVTVVELLP